LRIKEQATRLTPFFDHDDDDDEKLEALKNKNSCNAK